METYTCPCGQSFERPPTKGQRPKWCLDCRRSSKARGRLVPCAVCGTEVRKSVGPDPRTRVCGDVCRTVRKTGYYLPARADWEAAQRPSGEERLTAYRAARRAAGILAIAERRDRDALAVWLAERAEGEGDCLVWALRTHKGYPVTTNRKLAVHRLVFETHHGPVPKGDHVHHRCGRALCVAPDHLALSTARENIAEMLARTAYEARLAHLEDLAARMAAQLDPSDPLVREWRTTTAEGARM